jgi:hypothetical protein
MKPWYKSKWQAAKVRRALKLEDDSWRWWQEQEARKDKGTAAHIAQADRATAHALMVWSDDGGPATLFCRLPNGG